MPYSTEGYIDPRYYNPDGTLKVSAGAPTTINGQSYTIYNPGQSGSAADMAVNGLTGSFSPDILNQLNHKWDSLIGNSAITGPDGQQFIPTEIANKIGAIADPHKTSIFDFAPLILGGAFTGLAAGGAFGGGNIFGGGNLFSGGSLFGDAGGAVNAGSSLLNSSPLYSGGSNMGFFDDLLGMSDVGSGIDFVGGTVNGFPAADGLSYAGGSLMGDTSLGSLFPNGITGGLGDYLGAPYQQGFNLFDPSTYGGSSDLSFIDQLRKLTGIGNNGASIPGGGLGQTITNGLRGALGNGAGGSDLFGTLLSTAPALGAIAYAQGQQPFDTSKLESAYNQISPNALALPYDIQTGTGRNSLTSSLTDRGVMGSSFANQDLSSYDTLRQLGRQNLLTSGASSQANIANQILNAQIASQKNKNDLYGRALLALSGGLSPQKGIADLLGSLV